MKYTFLAFVFAFTASAYAKGVICKSSEPQDGFSYKIEAKVSKTKLTGLIVEWQQADERGHVDDSETLVDGESAELQVNYRPRNEAFKKMNKYLIENVGDSHSPSDVAILLPRILGGHGSTIEGHLIVTEAHVGLMTSEAILCRVSDKM